MNQERRRTELNDDEFDIEILMQKLYNVYKKTLYKLTFPFRVLLSKPKVLLSFIIASVAVAAILKVTLPPVYQADFILKPLDSRESYFINMIHDLGVITQDKDYEQLQKYLQLTEEQSMQIKKISYNAIYKGRFGDTLDAVGIVLSVQNRNLLDTLQNSIINFVENSPHYVKIKDIRRSELTQMEIKLQKDINEIDSLKHIIAKNSAPRGTTGFVFGEPMDPLKTYEKSIELTKQQITLNSQKSYLSNFELIKPCMSSRVPHSPKFFRMLLPVCLLVGLFLCLTYNLLRNNTNKTTV